MPAEPVPAEPAPDQPWWVLHSLVREELLDLPTAPFSDPAVDEPLRALLAGEPRRALTLLAQAPPADPRSAAALTAWARQLDGNWYPGDIGAESATPTSDSFVSAQAFDGPVALHLAMLVSFGPPVLRTARTLTENSMRMGAAQAVRDSLAHAHTALDGLADYATMTGQPALAPWLSLMGADAERRAGGDRTDRLLADARDRASALPSPARLALTYLVEGDWHAAPGASAEALGLALAPLNAPSPLGPPDPTRAAALWDQAETVLEGQDAPRLRAGLALRRAWQAGESGDRERRREQLGAAKELTSGAGDAAAYQLAVVHALVADIDEGRQVQVTDILEWAQTVGSRSWGVGLGRLLQRCGDRWAARSDRDRAKAAYLAAVPLVASDPAVPSLTLQTAVSALDSRFNLSVNALLRLERTFAPIFAPTSALRVSDDDFVFTQLLEAAASMVPILRDRAGGAAAAVTADRMQRLRDELEASRAAVATRLGPSSEPAPRTVAELQAAVAAKRGSGSLEETAAAGVAGMELMARMQLELAAQQVAQLDVLVAITRAEIARRGGVPAESERWYAEALARATRPGVEPYLPALVHLSAGRMDQAGAATAEAADQIADDIQFAVWTQVGDAVRGAATWERLRAAGATFTEWRQRLSVARLRLAQHDAAGASQELQQAAAGFADFVAGLSRDPDRLDACNQPDVASLFTLRASAALDLGDIPASVGAAEELRQLVFRPRETDRPDVGPAKDAAAVSVTDTWSAWQRAAAEYAAVSTTVVARLSADPAVPAPPTDPATPTTPAAVPIDFGELDRADQRVADAEAALDHAHPGVLRERAVPLPPPSVAALQGQLPEDTVCLEYLAVGQDLLGWAITRSRIVPSRHRLSYGELDAMVRAFHRGCSAGHAPSTPLVDLLLTPYADVLADHPRVVVVPFGPLHLVPFHALPLTGTPLALTHVVSYAPSLARWCATGGTDAVVDLSRPLVVGDPAFDATARPTLRPLPGSRLEAAAVATLVGDQDPLIGEAATEAAVTARLEECSLMHISSHGHLDELSPFSSSLVMAGAEEVTVAELVGLRFGTSLAVLSGCDTGRGNATLGGDVVGLTRSLMLGGARQVLVSLWPVDDWVAPVAMQRFYDEVHRGQPAAQALTETYRALHALDADALRAAYVEMGGAGEGGVAQRRGVVLDPELRDDVDLPAPLGGDAERFWGAFVLVG